MKHFFKDRGFPDKAIDAAVSKIIRKGTDPTNIILNKNSASKLILNIVIATRQLIGYEGGESSLAHKVSEPKKDTHVPTTAPDTEEPDDVLHPHRVHDIIKQAPKTRAVASLGRSLSHND